MLERILFEEFEKTRASLSSGISATLSSVGLTESQYWVLRAINTLASREVGGVATCKVAQEMFTPSPDISRMIAKLVRTKLVRQSERSPNDRRMRLVSLTRKGERALQQAEVRVARHLENRFSHLRPKELDELRTLLMQLQKG